MHVSHSSCNLALAILTTACLAACGGGDDAPNVVATESAVRCLDLARENEWCCRTMAEMT